MKIFEKEEFIKNFKLVRNNYLQIKNEYDYYLSLLNNSGSIYEFPEAEKIIDAVSENLELANGLKQNLSGINSIKRKLESMKSQLIRVEEKFTNLANGFIKYWNSDVSDIERADYSIEQGMVAGEYKDLLAKIEKVEGIIIFLEKEKKSETEEELNRIIDFYTQVQKTINIIIKNSKVNNNVESSAAGNAEDEVIREENIKEESDIEHLISPFDDIKSQRKRGIFSMFAR